MLPPLEWQLGPRMKEPCYFLRRPVMLRNIPVMTRQASAVPSWLGTLPHSERRSMTRLRPTTPRFLSIQLVTRDSL